MSLLHSMYHLRASCLCITSQWCHKCIYLSVCFKVDSFVCTAAVPACAVPVWDVLLTVSIPFPFLSLPAAVWLCTVSIFECSLVSLRPLRCPSCFLVLVHADCPLWDVACFLSLCIVVRSERWLCDMDYPCTGVSWWLCVGLQGDCGDCQEGQLVSVSFFFCRHVLLCML